VLIVTYRSDEPRPDRLGPYLAELDRGGRVERLELARFDRAATVAQLTGILDAIPAADLVDAVFVRSEGNPPRSYWRRCGLARVGCPSLSAICSGAGSRACRSSPGGC
jgi:hypothetical protein